VAVFIPLASSFVGAELCAHLFLLLYKGVHGAMVSVYLLNEYV
jgi:hypothetical protein